MSKFDRVMDKAAVFFWKHKFWFAIGGGVLAGYLAGRNYQMNENHKLEEKAKEEEKNRELIEEFKKRRAEYENNPANKLGEAGLIEGYDSYYNVDNKLCSVYMEVSGVKLEDLGNLGEEMATWSLRDDLDDDQKGAKAVISPDSECYITVWVGKPEKDELDEVTDAIKEACEADPAIEVTEF